MIYGKLYKYFYFIKVIVKTLNKIVVLFVFNYIKNNAN